MSNELSGACRQLVALLVERGNRVVLAESCTGGLVAASLARVPGVSDVLCGSAVTYRDETKAGWLGVERRLLNRVGPVSAQVARQMAAGALSQTPEAHLSGAVTGHLGPGAPSGMDGLVFIAVGRRRKFSVTKHLLAMRTRVARQREATLCVLRALIGTLNS